MGNTLSVKGRTFYQRLIPGRSIYYGPKFITVANLSLWRNFVDVGWVHAFLPMVHHANSAHLLHRRERRGHVCMSRRTCGNCERGWGLIMVETRGLTFQRDRWHTRLAHLRDFELWPETTSAAAVRADAEDHTGERRVVGCDARDLEGLGGRDGGDALWDCGRKRTGRGRNTVTRKFASPATWH